MPVNVRQTIPDGWAAHACCPHCGSAKMRVQHANAAADQMQCTACGLAFELEQKGVLLHVTQWPTSLPFLHIMVADDWRSAAELRILVKQMTSGPGESALTPPPVSVQSAPSVPPARIESAPVIQSAAPAIPPKTVPPPLDADAIGIRIKQLRALGNSPKEIRTTLTQAENEPQRVQAILGIITRMEQQEQSRQGKKLAWSLGILAGIVVLLVGAGYILYQKDYPNQPGQSAAPGVTVPPTQVPPNLVVKLMNLNTPVVNYNGDSPAASSSSTIIGCPRSAQQAAVLFGGTPADWYYPPGSNGWVMAHAGGSSANIFVPKGMKAAYLQLSNKLELIEVIGPATMTNAYYVAISCP